MANGTKITRLQEEVNKILEEYKFAFDCPHCNREINETHFSEKAKVFQFIKEKVRKVVEKEVDSRKSEQKEQWLEQVENEKVYEKFSEVIKDKKTIEELKKTNENKDKVIETLKVELSGAYRSDKIENLIIVKDLRKKLEEKQKEVESLKIKNEPEIQELRKNLETLKIKLSNAYSSDKVENLTRTQELKKELESQRKEVEKLKESMAKSQSSEEVEKLGRVKDLKAQISEAQKENEELKEKNRDLIISKSKDSQRKGEDFEKWFSEELLKVFDGRDNIKDISRGQTGTGKRADFLQEVLTDSEPKEVVGKIIYETKNTEKWENSWITKLENDMQAQGAEFGFIVATCANDKIVRLAESVDPRKKIYISDDNNNLFLVIKVIRELLITKHKLMKIDNVTDKEQKLIKVEEWTIDKLPLYILNLEKQFEKQENATKAIINNAEKLKKSKDEIYKLTIDNIISEFKKILK